MKIVDIRTKSFWGVWCSLTRKEHPETTCGLAWHMIFSIVTFPLWAFPGLVVNVAIIWYNKLFDKWVDSTSYVWYIFVNILSPVSALIYYKNTNPKYFEDASLLHLYFTGLLLLACIVVGVLIVIGLISIWEWARDKSRETTLSTLYRSVKEKHCSLINWKY